MAKLMAEAEDDVNNQPWNYVNVCHRVANELVVGTTGSVAEAVVTDGANAVSVTFEVVAKEDDVKVTIELGNDLHNWTPGDNSGSKTTIGSYTFQSTGIAFGCMPLNIREECDRAGVHRDEEDVR